MAEILAGKEGEERLLFKSVGGRPPTAAPPKDLKKEKERRKTRISDAAKKLPRNVRLLLDKPRVHFEGRRAEYRLREFQSTHPKKRTKRLCQAKSTAPEAWPGGVWPWGGTPHRAPSCVLGLGAWIDPCEETGFVQN